jgi:hypothetical protein
MSFANIRPIASESRSRANSPEKPTDRDLASTRVRNSESFVMRNPGFVIGAGAVNTKSNTKLGAISELSNSLTPRRTSVESVESDYGVPTGMRRTASPHIKHSGSTARDSEFDRFIDSTMSDKRDLGASSTGSADDPANAV